MNEPREYFWGCELNKENPSITWSFEEEDEDSDYLIHTLFLKHAVLGVSAVKDERNIVQVETKSFDKVDLKNPILSLVMGRNEMCNLDLSFGHEEPVTFRLVEGAGPVHISAQQLVEYPPEDNLSQDESALATEEEEDLLDETPEEAKSKKRKASSQNKGKLKKGKMEVSEGGSEEDEEDGSEEDEEDEEEEDMDDEDFDEDEESSPEKSDKKKGKKTKASDSDTGKKAGAKKGAKATKITPKKAAAKKGKKGAKK